MTCCFTSLATSWWRVRSELGVMTAGDLGAIPDSRFMPLLQVPCAGKECERRHTRARESLS
jgi:hypothetical protein